MHVRPRHHDFAELHLAKFDGAEDEAFFAQGQKAAFARLLNLHLEFFGGVHHGVAVRRGNTHGANDAAGNAVEQVNRRPERLQKPMEGPRNQQRHALGSAQADALGHQLAKDHVHSREQEKCQRQRRPMRDPCRSRAGCSAPDLLKRMRQRGFAESAQGQGAHRHPHLHAGNHALQVAEEFLHDSRGGIAAFHKLAHPRKAHGHQ